MADIMQQAGDDDVVVVSASRLYSRSVHLVASAAAGLAATMRPGPVA
jgi:hypothetical protein